MTTKTNFAELAEVDVHMALSCLNGRPDANDIEEAIKNLKSAAACLAAHLRPDTEE